MLKGLSTRLASVYRRLMSINTERLHKLRKAVREETEALRNEFASLDLGNTQTEKLLVEYFSDDVDLMPSASTISILSETFRSSSKYEAEFLCGMIFKTGHKVFSERLGAIAMDPMHMKEATNAWLSKLSIEERGKAVEMAKQALTLVAAAEAELAAEADAEKGKDGFDA